MNKDGYETASSTNKAFVKQTKIDMKITLTRKA